MTYVPLAEAKYRAQCLVFGTRLHGETGKTIPANGNFSARFRGHPWVERSITEGWDVDLRQHLVMVVTAAIMAGRDFSDRNKLMPDQKWVENVAARAEVYRKAKEWRDRCCAEHGSMEGYYAAVKHMPRVTEFEVRSVRSTPAKGKSLRDVIRGSLNRVEKAEEEQLSDLSRRMSGDDA